MTSPEARLDARRLTVRIAPEAIPRLPVFGWAAYRGGQRSDTPCLLDSPRLLFTTSGRAAIALALRALGVRGGDRVLVPTYHCPTMVAPAVHVGARPVFYPLRASGTDLSVLKTLDLTRVRAMLATHYFGLPQPMAELRGFCDHNGIALIEDCAHALFGVSDGRGIGTWGDYAIASLTKFFSVPEGGCLIVNRPGPAIPSLARRNARDEIKSMIDVLQLGVRYRRLPGLNHALGLLFALRRGSHPGGALGLEPVEVDLEEEGEDTVEEFDSQHAYARLTHAARLVVQSVSRSRIVQRRREHYRVLAEQFAGMPGVRMPWPSLPDFAVPYVFPLWVDEPDAAYYALKAIGVPVFRWDRLWTGTPFFPGDEGYSWSRHVLQFPCHQELSTADIDWLVGKVRDVLASRQAPAVVPAGTVRTAPSASAANSGRKVLMVAFHFPPLAGSSGIQRTLRFAQHLPALGWQPIVLTAHPRAYEATSDDLAAEVPREAIVRRAFALDASRHLAILGRYPAIAARPDRWISWWLGAVPEGLRLIRQYRPDVIWSTYPIATAHAIGATLARRSGLPWIADFRDPMAQEGYPADPLTWRRFAAIEARALREAALSVFAAPGAARMYRERYPDVAAGRLRVIPNGYDDETFAAAEARLVGKWQPLVEGRITLLHSGIVYPSERDPVPLFTALRRLVDRGAIDPARVRIRFRAPGHDAFLARLAAEHRLESLIEVAPSVPYREAIEEMLRTDALLILQASNCNDQVPAKLYEYARAGRPVLALTDPSGDTAADMRSFGLDAIAPLDSIEAIERALPAFLAAVKNGAARLPEPRAVAAASRRARSQELLALLEEVSTRSLARRDGP